MYGKLTIKTFVNTDNPDRHGRQTGRFATLITRYGISREEAEEYARNFADMNTNIPSRSMHVTWVAVENIYLD
jgi:hypothetical protein